MFVLKSTDLTYLHVCPLLASILPTTLLRCPVLSCFHAGDDTRGISATDCASSPLLSWWGGSGSSGVTKRLSTLRQAGVLCFIVFRVRQLGCSKDLCVHAHTPELAHVCMLTLLNLHMCAHSHPNLAHLTPPSCLTRSCVRIKGIKQSLRAKPEESQTERACQSDCPP